MRVPGGTKYRCEKIGLYYHDFVLVFDFIKKRKYERTSSIKYTRSAFTMYV